MASNAKENVVVPRPGGPVMPQKVYVLKYMFGKTTKDIAVFESSEKAMDIAIALKAALDATGQDGDYTADELPVWS